MHNGDAQRCYSLMEHLDEQALGIITKPSHLVGSENAIFEVIFEKINFSVELHKRHIL